MDDDSAITYLERDQKFPKPKGPKRRPPTLGGAYAVFVGYVAIEDEKLKFTFSRALESQLFRDKVIQVHEIVRTAIRIEFDGQLPWPAVFQLDRKRIAIMPRSCTEVPLYIGSVVFEYCNANHDLFSRASGILNQIHVLEFALDSKVQSLIGKALAHTYELIEIKTCKEASAILLEGCQKAHWKISGRDNYSIGDEKDHLQNMQRSGHTSGYKKQVGNILMTKENKLKAGEYNSGQPQSNYQIQKAKKQYASENPLGTSWQQQFEEMDRELSLL